MPDNPMTDIPIVELRTCPFCDSEAKWCYSWLDDPNGWGWVECPECGASSRPGRKDIATREWNTRAPDPALKECVEALENIRDDSNQVVGRGKLNPVLTRICELADATLAAMTKGEE